VQIDRIVNEFSSRNIEDAQIRLYHMQHRLNCITLFSSLICPQSLTVNIPLHVNHIKLNMLKVATAGCQILLICVLFVASFRLNIHRSILHGSRLIIDQSDGDHGTNGNFIVRCAKRKEAIDFDRAFDGWLTGSLSIINSSAIDFIKPLYVSEDHRNVTGIINKDKLIRLETVAYGSTCNEYVRLVKISSDSYHVFNFLAVPNVSYDLPIFGADIVFLPGRAIVTIDFQPLSDAGGYYDSYLYDPYKQRLGKWQAMFPPSGVVPELYREYFSPLALYASFPAKDVTGSLLFLIEQSLREYLQCYVEATALSALRLDASSLDGDRLRRREMLCRYLSFRRDKDPAKGLLSAAFGAAWTEQLLQETVFPIPASCV